VVFAKGGVKPGPIMFGFKQKGKKMGGGGGGGGGAKETHKTRKKKKTYKGGPGGGTMAGCLVFAHREKHTKICGGGERTIKQGMWGDG